MILEDKVKQECIEHAKKDSPREACGLVIIKKGRQIYWPCKNLAVKSDNFVLDPEDYAEADEAGDIVAVFHSHPNMSCKPSEADKVACEASAMPWFIVGLPSEQWHVMEPSGYEAPLVGRQWSHGVLDCYALCRDYYKREHGLDLYDFERRDEWWHNGENLYLDNFASQGFYEIEMSQLQPGDAILMTVMSKVPNHAAIYLGDNVILHHVHGRLSTRDVFGGYWMKNAVKFLRHEKSPFTG